MIELHGQLGPRLRMSVHRGCTRLPGVLLGSRALRWTMLRMVLGDVASWHRLYLVAKPSHVGVDVDGLACPLHRAMACSRQTQR
jgi:hypothetical protein